MGNENTKIIAVYAPTQEWGSVLNLASNLVANGHKVAIYQLKEDWDTERPALDNVVHMNSFVSQSMEMAQTIIAKADYLFFTQLKSEVCFEYDMAVSCALGLSKPITFIYSKDYLREQYGDNDKFLLVQKRRVDFDTDLYGSINSLVDDLASLTDKSCSTFDYHSVICLNIEPDFNERFDDDKKSMFMELAYDDMTDAGVRYTVDTRKYSVENDVPESEYDLSRKALYSLGQKFIKVKRDRALPKGVRVYTQDDLIQSHILQSVAREQLNYNKFFGKKKDNPFAIGGISADPLA